jgi:hypothetical protein
VGGVCRHARATHTIRLGFLGKLQDVVIVLRCFFFNPCHLVGGGIDQAGQQRCRAQVDDLGAGRNCQPAAGRGDLAIHDQHHGVGHIAAGFYIQHALAADRGDLGAQRVHGSGQRASHQLS